MTNLQRTVYMNWVLFQTGPFHRTLKNGPRIHFHHFNCKHIHVILFFKDYFPFKLLINTGGYYKSKIYPDRTFQPEQGLPFSVKTELANR